MIRYIKCFFFLFILGSWGNQALGQNGFCIPDGAPDPPIFHIDFVIIDGDTLTRPDSVFNYVVFFQDTIFTDTSVLVFKLKAERIISDPLIPAEPIDSLYWGIYFDTDLDRTIDPEDVIFESPSATPIGSIYEVIILPDTLQIPFGTIRELRIVASPNPATLRECNSTTNRSASTSASEEDSRLSSSGGPDRHKLPCLHPYDAIEFCIGDVLYSDPNFLPIISCWLDSVIIKESYTDNIVQKYTNPYDLQNYVSFDNMPGNMTDFILDSTRCFYVEPRFWNTFLDSLNLNENYDFSFYIAYMRSDSTTCHQTDNCHEWIETVELNCCSLIDSIHYTSNYSSGVNSLPFYTLKNKQIKAGIEVVIENTKKNVFRAGEEIILEAGFETEPGSIFEASILPECLPSEGP